LTGLIDDPVQQGMLQGRYRLETVLGSGGMATVYRAHDELLGRRVAVKIFRPHAEDNDELRSQEIEARVLASLSMFGLVTLFDAGVDFGPDGRPRVFLVMEYVEGADLKQALAVKQAFTMRQVAFFGHDLTEALEYVHDHGVIHRDIKPANVLLLDFAADRRPRVKLADFGVATIVGHGSLLDDEYTTGTAAYLSPEQAAGEPIGPPTDVYSLGLVLLECLTGKVAFPGGVVESAMARLTRSPEIPASLPDEWRQLLGAMTARDPAARPPLGELMLAFRQLVVEDLSGRHRSVEPEVVGPAEQQRMEAVARYNILDTPADGDFDRITRLAAQILDVPAAVVSIVDHERIWFKSRHGVEAAEIGRDPGLCASAILSDELLHIRDALVDERAMANPLVQGSFGVRFYAGVPLKTQDGYNLGTLAVLDTKPRELTARELSILRDLAAMVMHELDLRLSARRAVLARS
jgi:tRNA A-37 threonylcarbamoyl transferase component Bud32